MGDYLQLTKDKFHLRTAHSKVVGFWITELGGVNEAVHLWEYGKFMLCNQKKHSMLSVL